jgi:CheY-like chemotaxis protein
MKVLVVDDVGYSRHYHARLLQKFGYTVESAENGLQALKVLERDAEIGVVLTDLMMREMDGVELFKRSRRINRMIDGGNSEPPSFILMTALRPGKDATQQRDVEKIRQAKDIGFIDVLYKPIEPEALKTTLEVIKFARGRARVDTTAIVKRIAETVDRLIADNLFEDADQFLTSARKELERLEQFTSQPAST